MAENKGVSIKVETNGSAGVKNKLTKDEIENATCIIVAQIKMLRWLDLMAKSHKN